MEFYITQFAYLITYTHGTQALSYLSQGHTLGLGVIYARTIGVCLEHFVILESLDCLSGGLATALGCKVVC